jgi:very-short-patch-repair endonuclease
MSRIDFYDDDYVGSEVVDGPSFAPLGVVLQGIADWIVLCESPIELSLAISLAPILPDDVQLIAQYPLQNYRMDFAIVADGRPLLFIECDGRAFHSTPAQLANDAAKDKTAARLGIPLLRLTGSAIFRDAPQRARDIAAMIEGLA